MLGKNQKHDQKSQEVEHKIILSIFGGDGGEEEVVIRGELTYHKLEKAARDWVRDLRWDDWNFWPSPEPKYTDFPLEAIYDYGEDGGEHLVDWTIRHYPSNYKVFYVDEIYDGAIEYANEIAGRVV